MYTYLSKFHKYPPSDLERRHVNWQTHITTHPLHIQFVCVRVQNGGGEAT